MVMAIVILGVLNMGHKPTGENLWGLGEAGSWSEPKK